MATPLLVAKSGKTELCLLPAVANRHGLITGATGTGKTVTLQTLAHGFSSMGVPVFMADVKGDLSGLAKSGGANAKVSERLNSLKIRPEFSACPTSFWDVYGRSGIPVRATVSDMGPLLLGRMLGLNDTQEGVLGLVFKIADDNGLLLLDLKDLRAMLQYVGDNAARFKTEYGNVSTATIGIIQRGLLNLEGQGAAQFFGEPMLDLADLMQTRDGKGIVNILAADKLLSSPRLYATFLLWMLSELLRKDAASQNRKSGLGHPLRQDRAARRQAIAGADRSGLEERRARHRLGARTPGDSRRPRLDSRRRKKTLSASVERGLGR